MEPQYIYALIGIGAALLGTLVGSWIAIVHDRIKETDRIKSEIQSRINEVALTTVSNDYPAKLNSLRTVIVKNAHILVKNDDLTSFFAKWLNNPILHLNRPTQNHMDSEKIEEMLKDLGKIKL